jgi:hypothetical protein
MPSRALLRIVLIAGIGLGACPKAHAQDLGVWRPLTAEEEKARIGSVPPKDADPSMIEADFDGDRAKDKALIAVRTTDGARGLIVALKSRLHVLVLSGENKDGTEADKSPLLDAGIRVAKPGPWRPNCFEDCSDNPPKTVVLKNPGILFYDDASTMLYRWDAKNKQFTGSLMVH